MAPAAKKDKDSVPVLKGKEAEQAILDYIKKANRPYGSADISANLKNAVPKTATQKILLSLAEGGKITQKTFGKVTIFVAKQDELETPDAGQMKELQDQLKDRKEQRQEAQTRVKQGLEQELAKLRAEPTDDQLQTQIATAEGEVERLRAELEPLRSAAPSATPEEMEQIDKEWLKWRGEWKARKKVFQELFSAVADAMTKDEKEQLESDLGIELDSSEHLALEKSSLCTAPPPRPVKPIKR